MSQLLFSLPSLPFLLVGADGRILAENEAARSRFGRLAEVELRALLETPLPPGDADCVVPLPASPGEEAHLIRLEGKEEVFFLVVVVPLGMATLSREDPVTGLPDRRIWERVAPTLAHEPGCVVFFDLDELKTVNDLYGHEEGDRMLAMIGRVLREEAPKDAFLVRHGGDEFLAVLPGRRREEGERFARAVNERLAEEARRSFLPIAPVLSFGVAAFAAGALAEAVASADAHMYEQKGTLLRAKSGARIVIARAQKAQGALDDLTQLTQGEEALFLPEPILGSASGLPGFAEEALAEAKAFVAWLSPPEGGAVVEVGAGTGRLALTGGLAARVGPEGAILLTDPSPLYLKLAQEEALRQGIEWLRFLVAPAEALPIASQGPDLVLGAWFLHLCRAEEALAEMARVVRPGGRIALALGPRPRFPRPFRRLLEPLRQAISGRQTLPAGLSLGATAGLIGALGLDVEAERRHFLGRFPLPSLEALFAFLRHEGYLRWALGHLPIGERQNWLRRIEEQAADVYHRTPKAERFVVLESLWLKAKRPYPRHAGPASPDRGPRQHLSRKGGG